MQLHKKDLDEIFNTLSSMLALYRKYYNKKSDPYVMLRFELDAKSSGLQMWTILLQSLELWEFCKSNRR